MWRGILSCFRQAVNARARKDGEGCAACRPELFRSEIAHPHTGGPRLSRPCPLVAHPLHPRPGARSTRADTPHADPNCSEAKSRDPTREGRACRGRAPWSQHVVTGPCTRSTRAAHGVGRRRAPRTESRPTAPRAGGGAGTSRADTPHADPNCSEAKSRAPTREGRTPARPGGPSAASATTRRTRAHPRGAARETSRHRPRPPMPTGHKCRTFRTAIHEQQPNRHFQPRHKHPRPRIRQQKKYEQNTRKGVPEPQTCRRHHQHSGRSRVDIKHYYINVQRIIRPEDFVISRIGICPSFVFFVPRTT